MPVPSETPEKPVQCVTGLDAYKGWQSSPIVAVPPQTLGEHGEAEARTPCALR